jgi:hypothetical protein
MPLDGMRIIMRNIYLMGQAGARWVDGHLHCNDLSTTVLCWEREQAEGKLLAAKKPGRYPYGKAAERSIQRCRETTQKKRTDRREML